MLNRARSDDEYTRLIPTGFSYGIDAEDFRATSCQKCVNARKRSTPIMDQNTRNSRFELQDHPFRLFWVKLIILAALTILPLRLSWYPTTHGGTPKIKASMKGYVLQHEQTISHSRSFAARKLTSDAQKWASDLFVIKRRLLSRSILNCSTKSRAWLNLPWRPIKNDTWSSTKIRLYSTAHRGRRGG